MDELNRNKDIDDLLKRIITENARPNYYPFKELFEQRLVRLGITKHQARKILGIDHKTLDSILTGDSKKLDFVTILKLSDFLEVSQEEIVNKYFQLVSETHNENLEVSKKRSFIVNNFNLSSLKKIGFINSINDFDHIESRINTFFGYESIFEHSKHKVTAAFSSGKRATNKENLSFWYAAARQSLDKTPNPNEFDRDGLKEFFPHIRWHSMDVEKGLLLVAQALFKLGVTLIIVPKFTTDLHIKGATLCYRDKPCIVLTKYTAFYATLWFTLIHELFHVLYDWEQIKKDEYHITGETESIKINESEADNFARQYLFPDEKMNLIRSHLDEPLFVKHFAEQNHVHPSMIYTFNCWDVNTQEIYKKYNKNTTLNFDSLLNEFETMEFLDFIPVKKISAKRNALIFNPI